MQVEIQTHVERANTKLKPIKMAIRINGSKLYIEGRLPPKPIKDQVLDNIQLASQGLKQQKISPGLKADPHGGKLAESMCMEIYARLTRNTFDWLDYWQPPAEKKVTLTAAYWIEKFKEDFFRDRDSPSLRATWRGHFQMAYKHLPQDEEITEECLINCLKLQKPESRSRNIYYKALTRLVAFIGLGIDLSKYKGDYSPKQLNVRDIPSDEVIAELIEGIKDPEWKYIFGLMAIYGLRPHECWLHDLELPNIYVHEETKTGRRLVFPIPEEWIELFGISGGTVPKVTVQSNSDYGNRACKYARKYGLPVPYTFRHAYALRMIHAGVPDAVAAACMGHDLVVHNKTYQRWLSKRDHQQVFDNLSVNKAK